MCCNVIITDSFCDILWLDQTFFLPKLNREPHLITSGTEKMQEAEKMVGNNQCTGKY